MAVNLCRQILKPRYGRTLKLALVSRNYADAPSAPGLNLTFGTPSQSFYNSESVNQVDVPSGSGNFCILPQHVPIIAVLKPGLLTVAKEGGTEKYFVSSGTITVNNDSSAQILAEEAAPLDHFDADAARRNADTARQRLSGASDDLERAKAQIEVDACEALVHALEGK